MSRKKKKHQNNRPQVTTPLPSQNPALPSPEAFSRQITFDSLEDKIRGEDMIQEQEQTKLKEGREIQKELESAEVDRRLEQLRQQLGLTKNAPKSRKK
ncbi:MAG: hypothetical protein ACRD4B_03010 [Acidobacteriota bacterium]